MKKNINSSTETPVTFHRYPGLHSFQHNVVHPALFFGRESESEELTQRLRANRLLILYGESGHGKTSLIQAGLFPRLRQHQLLPLRIRFNDQNITSLIEHLETQIQREVDTYNQLAADNDLPEIVIGQKVTQSWWEYLKTTVFWCGDSILKPVLVLDQFEEIFTLQKQPIREAVAKELGHLINNTLPPDMLQSMRDGSCNYSETAPEVRIILSLRIEHVGRLQLLFPHIPSILRRRFIVNALTREQARLAITEPASQKLEGVSFLTTPFRFTEKALENLLDFLADPETGTIAPYQLQIHCEEIERKVHQLQKQGGEPIVDDALLGDTKNLEQVEERIYFSALDGLKDHIIHHSKSTGLTVLARWQARQRVNTIRELCDFGLINDQGVRLPLTLSSINKHYPLIKPADLEFLLNRRLLRREAGRKTGRESFIYELAHDSLAKAIFKSRPNRISASVRKRLAILGVAGLIVIAGLAGYAWWVERNLNQTETDLAVTTDTKQRNTDQSTDYISKLIEEVDRLNNENTQLIAANDSINATLKAAQSENSSQTSLIEKLNQAQQQAQNVSSVVDKSADNRPALVPLPELVTIEPGCFLMGSPQGDGEDDEHPQHKVCFGSSFAMGAHEVTFEQYDVFGVQTGRDLPDDNYWGRETQPVINVSWRDAVAYTEWLGKQTNQACRLPSEAEWEYAARAGTQTNYWWDSNEVGENNANCDGCGSEWDNKQTAPVGSFAANPWGLYDTVGNVWEWTADVWHGDYSGAPGDGGVWGQENGGDVELRVVRGGSWSLNPVLARAAGRFRFFPGLRNHDLGFRVVCVPH